MNHNLSEREKKLLRIITETDASSVSGMSSLLGVSTVTIRNDLKSLADRGLIIRTHGGASPAFHPGVLERQKMMLDEKNGIAKQAASLVKNGDAIMVEAGTTTSLIVKYLMGTRDVQLVSNSMLVLPFARINPGIHLTIIGGEFRPATESLVGSIALEELSRFHVKLAFVGTDGYSLETGLTTHLIEGAEIVKKMAAQAEKTILVADSSKYGKRGFAHVLDIRQIDEIITDPAIIPEAVSGIREKGIIVRITGQKD